MSEQTQQIQEILKKSLLKIKSLEAELEKSTTPKYDDIVVVGMGTRFPQGINTLEKLWSTLLEKKDVVSLIPNDRFDISQIYDADPLAIGKTNARHGAFLTEDVRAFDAEFFGISPREAKSIDPLQRMMLEVVYEALENAGIASDSLKDSKTDVFVALGNSDYIQARFRSGNLEKMDVYDATGIPFATAAGRISYLFDLQGHSFALDAACSSTLVGLHLAAQNLRTGISDNAIVVAANLILTPELYVGLAKMGSLSPSGICRAFDENADGYVRGEGCGVLVLKRKDDAIREKLNLLATLKGSAIKHDGHSNGFTAPNPKAQQNVIEDALAAAQIDPKDVVFVEAHGIGNKLTDGMEIQAIAKGYKNNAMYVGSLKPNIGHLEAAIGMAMIQKVIATLKHSTIAPNTHFETPNTDINWEKLNIKIPTEAIPIEKVYPIYAAVNLSGYSGTNTHAIFGQAPSQQEDKYSIFHQNNIFVLSAKSDAALKDLAQKYLQDLSWQKDLAKTCYTLLTGRNHLDFKLSITSNDIASITESLNAFVNGETHKILKTSNTNIKKGIAFVFTGQGSQYKEMCKSYYTYFPLFKTEVDKCASILLKNNGIDILAILFDSNVENNEIDQTANTQPALFVVEYALSQLWLALGIKPEVLLGHSIGEYVAMTVSGILELEDALNLVAKRGLLMQSLPQNSGGMIAVLSNKDTVMPFLENYKNSISIAAINSERTLTLSGEKSAVQNISIELKANGIKTIELQVSHAFHSAMMEPILNEFELEAQKIKIHQGKIPVLSNLTGKTLEQKDINANYFSNHLRGTVNFLENIITVQQQYDIDHFIECGPQPILLGFIKNQFKVDSFIAMPSAKKDTNDIAIFFETIVQLYHLGYPIQYKKIYEGINILPADYLPNYAWQRKIYWENPVRNFNETIEKPKEEKTSTPIQKVTRESLMAVMQLEAAHVLGLEPGKRIEGSKNLREQGFDSMMSGEYLSRLEKYLGTTLEMSLIHIYGTLDELHQHFIDTYFGGGEVLAKEAVTMSDIMFGGDMGTATSQQDWHTILPEDASWLKVFKKLDKKIKKN
jgi:acyl transferase domain-containing protein